MKCELCAGNIRLEVSGVGGIYAAEAYDILACVDCGMAVNRPEISEEQLQELYASDYNYKSHEFIQYEKRWRSELLLKKRPTKKSILEIGCMHGFLLDVARARGFEKICGVEIDGSARNFCNQKGFEVFGNINEINERTFDVIILQHVLEHIPDHRDLLLNLFQMLEPGGELIICVPNFNCFTRKIFKRSWGWYQVPIHLRHYTQKSLTGIVEGAGFSNSRVETRGADSLMILITIAGLFGVANSQQKISSLKRKVIKLASILFRPYIHFGNEELILTASKT